MSGEGSSRLVEGVCEASFGPGYLFKCPIVGKSAKTKSLKPGTTIRVGICHHLLGECSAARLYGDEETAKLTQDDPTVKAGLVQTEIHPWGTGKGVLTSGKPMQ